jgi:precorrin-3B synthase
MTDACPGVLRLHEAADGLLARVRLPGGRLTAEGMRAVAAASRLGNGIIELTSRASLQIRGLDESPESVLKAGGLLPSPTHERVRNIIASPLAGPETFAIVEQLDRAICSEPAMSGVSARWLFAVDDGSGLHGRQADVTITSADQIAGALSASLEGRAIPAATAPRGVPIGASGRFLTVLPPLGRLSPEQLDSLAELVGEIRIGVARTFTAVDADPADLRDLGFIDDPRSGWIGLSACAGLGACRRALHDVRAAAAGRALERVPGDPDEHWSACERRCGRPAGPHRGFVATVAGVVQE